jgi:colanic acid/amylovoran biosynthesis glycosyltransferase
MNLTQRRRIAYLVSKYPDFSHTFILREVLALRQRGLEIEVASVNDAPAHEKLTQIEREEAARTFYVKRSGAAGVLSAALWLLSHKPAGLFRGLAYALKLGHGDPLRTARCLFYYLEALLLAKWMHDRSVTHLHVHFATPAATVGLVLTHVVPISLSMTVHGPDEFYDVSTYFLTEKIEAAKFIVCISYFAQSQLMKLTAGHNWDKFDIARLGVDSSQFSPRPFRASPAPFQLLCVGRLVAAKGQRILIQAVELLLKAGHNLQLHLVGDGPDRASLEALVAHRGLSAAVSFAGIVNQENIRAFYQDADAFAIASFAEGIPVVLMEAMAMEIPCVATRITGIPELIEDGADGLLVSPSDVDGMAAAIARLIGSAEIRESLGKAARARVQREYELATSADRLSSIFAARLERLQ